MPGNTAVVRVGAIPLRPCCEVETTQIRINADAQLFMRLSSCKCFRNNECCYRIFTRVDAFYFRLSTILRHKALSTDLRSAVVREVFLNARKAGFYLSPIQCKAVFPTFVIRKP